MPKDEYSPGNETYRIKVSSPLLRPGLEIETEVSGRYVGKALAYILQEVRKFNEQERSRRETVETKTEE